MPAAENALTVLENRRIMVPEMNGRRFEELITLRCTLETPWLPSGQFPINHMIDD